MLVFSLMIMPKVTVGIVDKTGGAPVKVVANVPLGIAALGSLTSTVGHTLTGLFETAFQVIPGAGALPSELSYQKNGLLFGHRLVRETRNVVFQDPAFRTDLINFLYHCSSYDLMDGSLDPGQFSRNENVWELLGNPNPARFSTLTTTGTVDIATCPQVYANLDQRLPAELRRIEGRLAFSLNPTLPGTVAAGVIANEIQQAYLKTALPMPRPPLPASSARTPCSMPWTTARASPGRKPTTRRPWYWPSAVPRPSPSKTPPGSTPARSPNKPCRCCVMSSRR